MLYLADYSDKSIVVYGNTFPYKQTLKMLKGRFNKHLSIVPGKSGGWIFSRKNQKHLEDFVKSVGGKIYLEKKSIAKKRKSRRSRASRARGRSPKSSRKKRRSPKSSRKKRRSPKRSRKKRRSPKRSRKKRRSPKSSRRRFSWSATRLLKGGIAKNIGKKGTRARRYYIRKLREQNPHMRAFLEEQQMRKKKADAIQKMNNVIIKDFEAYLKQDKNMTVDQALLKFHRAEWENKPKVKYLYEKGDYKQAGLAFGRGNWPGRYRNLVPFFHKAKILNNKSRFNMMSAMYMKPITKNKRYQQQQQIKKIKAQLQKMAKIRKQYVKQRKKVKEELKKGGYNSELII